MARTPVDKSIPVPLRALGGWTDAAWFDASILQGSEVVSIILPALPGVKKQNFELAERSALRLPPKKAARPKSADAALCEPAGISAILDDVGARRAAAFRRPRFFFEAAPTLFFADIPPAHLKAKAAERLRRNLIQNAYRGCVLACDADAVMIMVWPGQEAELTRFIRAAAPAYPLHPQFDQAGKPTAAATRRGRPAAPAATLQTGEHEKLLAELDGLRAKIVELERKQSIAGAMETLGLDDARLKAMLLLLHPDKHGNSEAANAAAKWVNGLRDVLKGSRAQ